MADSQRPDATQPGERTSPASEDRAPTDRETGDDPSPSEPESSDSTSPQSTLPQTSAKNKSSKRGRKGKKTPRSAAKKRGGKRRSKSDSPRDRAPAVDSPRRAEDARLRRTFREIESWVRRRLTQELGEIPLPTDLELSIPLKIAPGDRSTRAERRFANDIDREILRVRDELTLDELGYRPGHLYCHWCSSSICEHTTPVDPRAVFIGYDPTGTPRWRDFSSWVVERRDPRLDRLYLDDPLPLAVPIEASALTEELLPEFACPEGQPSPYVIAAQLVAGCFRLPTRSGGEIERGVALTAQIVERRGPGGEPSFSLNVLCSPPPPHHLPTLISERLHPVLSPWLRGLAASVRDLERRLRTARREGRRASIDRNRAEAVRIVVDAEKQLEKYVRQDGRRTQHATRRTQDPQRPTASALSDALKASNDQLFLDRAQQTLIVRGPRNRVHVFKDDGTHVTSIVYNGKAIAERIQQQRWLPLDPGATEAFRAALTLRSQSIEESEGSIGE